MTNVTEKILKSYIETFHTTLSETSEEYLPSEFHSKLLHLSLLPAGIIGYVSTKYGVAIEYVPADKTSIQIMRGSARVEDLLVQAPAHLRSMAPAFRVSGSYMKIVGFVFSNGFPFRLDGREASLSVEGVQVTAEKWSRSISYAEIYGNRESDNWSKEKAISRGKNEVLAAWVEVERSKSKNIELGEYITRFKPKTVLLLGKYDSEGETRLGKIAEIVKNSGYDAVLLKEIPDDPFQSLSQKLTTVGSLARFVIVDDSSASGHLNEVEHCRQNNWVTVLLRAGGKGGTFMTAGASIYSTVILEKSYDSSSPEPAVAEAILWAEQKLVEVKQKIGERYWWRTETQQG